MAELIDFGGEANSNLVAGLGTSQAVFTMPGNRGLKVQSVVATINNGTANDVTATVTIRDSSGQVIATKRQADVIPSGDVGTATWALRLDDNDGTGIRFRRTNTGSWILVNATGISPGSFTVGTQLAQFSFGVQGVITGVGASNTLMLSAGVNTQITSGQDISINADGELQLGADDLDASFDTTATIVCGGDVTIGSSSSGPVTINAGAVQVVLDGSGVTVTLATGDTLTVKNNSGNPIFRVDEDGDLHGLTGKSLTFDL